MGLAAWAWIVLAAVDLCLAGRDTEEALAHYLVTNPTTDHPILSREREVYKIIEDEMLHWQTAPETEEPSIDSEGMTRTPEPRAPRWWNQYMQEKYGDPPVFPDWSNETQVENYLKTKKRKKWTPSQESFEPMKPNEEPFTWSPILKLESGAWTQPTWDSEEIKRIGDEMIIERKDSDDSYVEEPEYKVGPDSSTNFTETSEETPGTGVGHNKTAAAASSLARQRHKQRQMPHVPAKFNRNLVNARRKAKLRTKLSPQDLEVEGKAQNQKLIALQRYARLQHNHVLRKRWHEALIKKMGKEIGAEKVQGHQQENRKRTRKRRPEAPVMQRLH